MPNLLKDKKAIITGGTSGIGKEIALHFVEEGCSVAILGTSSERANLALQELEKAKVDPTQKIVYELVDVSKYSDVEKTFTTLFQEFGKIDILVNNAGITRDNLLLKMSEEDWDEVLRVNLKSAFNTCKCVIRAMIKERHGKIINISSVVGLMGNAGQVNYAASKAGMIGFTKALAKEVATRNICVNCIAPGYIETKMTEGLSEQIKEALIARIPMQRLGKSEDVAKSALFLASSLSDYMTGQVLVVDGGMVM